MNHTDATSDLDEIDLEIIREFEQNDEKASRSLQTAWVSRSRRSTTG